ncbi:hypothetical protein ZWY2020_024937, partial [Hordeum vulgare]
MKVVHDIEDGELHLASTNEGDLRLVFDNAILGSDLGTMLISEGARLKGSRFCSSVYIYCMLMVSWMRAWWAFITQHSVTELVVAVFVV